MGGDAGDVHAPALELDEEEDIQAAQPDGVDGEEVALDDPGCLLAQKLAPAQLRAARDGLDGMAAQMFQTVLGESLNPSPLSSPWMRL